MRLATFNAQHAWSGADRAVSVAGFRDAVVSLDADVLALQELDHRQPRTGELDLAAVAAEAMAAVHHRYVPALIGTPGRTWRIAADTEPEHLPSYGVGLLSRFPVTEWEVVRLPRIHPWFPIWLPRPRGQVMVRDEPRVALLAHLRTPSGPVVVAGTHLTFVPGWSRLQLRALAQALAAHPDPVLIMGDLNLLPDTAARTSGYRPIATHATYPASRPVRQLDHILLRGDLGAVSDSGARRLPLSDHRALWVDLVDGRG